MWRREGIYSVIEKMRGMIIVKNRAYTTLVTKETIAIAMKTNSWLRPNVYALFFL